jgi:hypothetical protein
MVSLSNHEVRAAEAAPLAFAISSRNGYMPPVPAKSPR